MRSILSSDLHDDGDPALEPRVAVRAFRKGWCPMRLATLARVGALPVALWLGSERVPERRKQRARSSARPLPSPARTSARSEARSARRWRSTIGVRSQASVPPRPSRAVGALPPLATRSSGTTGPCRTSGRSGAVSASPSTSTTPARSRATAAPPPARLVPTSRSSIRGATHSCGMARRCTTWARSAATSAKPPRSTLRVTSRGSPRRPRALSMPSIGTVRQCTTSARWGVR